jgi:hypothetical protein
MQFLLPHFFRPIVRQAITETLPEVWCALPARGTGALIRSGQTFALGLTTWRPSQPGLGISWQQATGSLSCSGSPTAPSPDAFGLFQAEQEV